MTRILAIDTATEACSAALLIDGEVREQYQLAPRQHAELILPMVESLLADAGSTLSQLDALAFGCGPGAFTGVRIATGVIQGLAFAADLPVVSVSTLAALAQGAFREKGAHHVMAGLDARMHEVYWGNYQLSDTEIMELMGDECVCVPMETPVPDDGSDWTGYGSAWGTYAAELSERMAVSPEQYFSDVYPHARDVAVLAEDAFARGESVSAEQAQPVYLRDNVAAKKNVSRAG